MTKYRLLPVLATLSATLAAPAYAQSLQQLFDAARSYDAAFLSSRLQHDATLAKSDQARAAILPTAGLAMGLSRSNQQVSPDIGASSERQYGTESATVSISQPLYRPANWSGYQQGLKQIDLAKAQLQSAEQDLIVRVSQAYFDVLASQDSLTFVQAQKAAVAEQLAFAKRNFEVGTSTITDTREAQARFDLVIAQEIAADNDLRIKRIALDQLVGVKNASPKALRLPAALGAISPADVDVWVRQAQDAHPGLAQAKIAVEIAKMETAKADAGHLPTLDVSASYSNIKNRDGSSAGAVGSTVNSGTIGLSLNVPLFAGFATQNRIRETMALEDKAQADLEVSRRAVSQATRTAYFGVLSGLGQVKAFEAAEASSMSALDANKLGYQVGVRINIDVLNSQSQLFDTRAKLAKARYDVLLGGLKLRQANGTLRGEDLSELNRLLAN